MKRLLILLALAGIGSSFACSKDSTADEDDDDDKADAGTDAAAPVADAAVRLDGSAQVVVKVENAGAQCTIDKDCTGAMATCQTSLGQGAQTVKLEGGYCSAMCASSAECGTGAACPVVEVTSGLQLPFDITGAIPIPSLCLDKCDVKESGACRTGYECKNIASLVPAQFRTGIAAVFLQGPAFTATYCMPPITIDLPVPDAGRPDAGSPSLSRLVGGLDAGN